MLWRSSLYRLLCTGFIVSVVGGAARMDAQPVEGNARSGARWLKGNLHTHSLWSDGDDYPEMIAAWYKNAGYQFLAISDHNVVQEGSRWLELKPDVRLEAMGATRGGGDVLRHYLDRFGPDWVEQRSAGGKNEVRLKPLAEYRTLLEEPGKFLMIPSEEITSNWKRPASGSEPERGGPVHMNVTNVHDRVGPIEADNALAIMQKAATAIVAQRLATGQPMFLHLNHPNFVWGVTAEELMQVHDEKFFEVYNGHPGVHNAGDATHLSNDAIWDVLLTRRLSELKLPLMYGIGVDDSHHYHQTGIGKSNPGRGWVMVRAKTLTPESIIAAMEAGDFYASSGVVLTDVVRRGARLAVDIQPVDGVTYRTQFIGTRHGYDPTSQLILPTETTPPSKGLPHRRYSKDVGAVLGEVSGVHAEYALRGDEIYVRAKIVSSKPKVNGSVADEFETAWTQPLVPEALRD